MVPIWYIPVTYIPVTYTNYCYLYDQARISVRPQVICDDQDEDSSDDEILSLIAEDGNSEFLSGMLMYAMHYDKYCTRAPYRQPFMSGLQWVQNKLQDRDRCYKMFRISPTMFYRLHELLTESYGLKSSKKSSSIEALGMFLWMVGAPQSVRQAEDRLERSLGTVHTNFYKVLKCLTKLAKDIIKPEDSDFTAIHPRLMSPRFYPFFKDCIGAIDGTHVPCVVPSHKVIQHMCRKGMTTQNVLVVCNFDMKFTFVLAGWPGSVHDMRVFTDATTTFGHVFPHPPTGKHPSRWNGQITCDRGH